MNIFEIFNNLFSLNILIYGFNNIFSIFIFKVLNFLFLGINFIFFIKERSLLFFENFCEKLICLEIMLIYCFNVLSKFVGEVGRNIVLIFSVFS